MNENERKPAPVGQEVPKSPADRVRLIQEMQRAAEAAPMQQAQQAQVHQAEAPLSPAISQPISVPDAFAVKQVNAVAQALANKTTPTEANAYAKLQKSTQALFGGSNDIEVLGNPWKVIPFGDALPALFDDVKDAKATVPEKAVKHDDGALFELGLTPKGAEKPTQKRAVLVNAQGKLAGAECRTPQDATRLLATAKWLLPESATRKDTSWRVSAGTDSAFTLEIDRGVGKAKGTERLALDNFGRVTTQGRKSDIIVANYFLDRFDAGL
ncbi:MAG: hypothetical protein JNJ54_15095 [Myxococcaceae bacterium]|nr:hypothetical protein [Myxococcaceae bacterium]